MQNGLRKSKSSGLGDRIRDDGLGFRGVLQQRWSQYDLLRGLYAWLYTQIPSAGVAFFPS